MRKLMMGWGVAALVALTGKTEARPPASFSKLSEGAAALRRAPLAKLQSNLIPRAELGLASWYGEESSGITANGEIFDKEALTAAHRTLPLGSKIEVTNLRNNKSLVLQVNDRGPNIAGRMLDVSRAAARRLGFLDSGKTAVRVRLLSFPPQYIAWFEKPPTLCMAPGK